MKRKSAGYNDTFPEMYNAKTPEELGIPALEVQSEGEVIYYPRFAYDPEGSGWPIILFGHYWGGGDYSTETIMRMTSGLDLYGGDPSPNSKISSKEIDKVANYITDNFDQIVEGLESEEKTASRKTAGMPVPSAYQLVMEDMKKAEKEGKDSFPRAFHHILRNYILNHVATAYKDQWMIPLINDGYCLNPYGTNIRVKSAKTWKDLERSKKAQELEKEVELEVTDKPVDMGEQFYPGTKTPIEISDSVKFGDKKGTVVELMGEHVIVKSKGMEYRVPTEEIEPLPSTFRKMYM